MCMVLTLASSASGLTAGGISVPTWAKSLVSAKVVGPTNWVPEVTVGRASGTLLGSHGGATIIGCWGATL